MMFMITLIVLLWYSLAQSNFGCIENYTYDGYANNDIDIFSDHYADADTDTNTGDSTTYYDSYNYDPFDYDWNY